MEVFALSDGCFNDRRHNAEVRHMVLVIFCEVTSRSRQVNSAIYRARTLVAITSTDALAVRDARCGPGPDSFPGGGTYQRGLV